MKTIFLVVVLFISSVIFGQVQGDIVKDGRKLITETTFVLEGKVDVRIVYDIAVDSKGNVTSASRVLEESTIKSTPVDIKVRKYVKDFKFEPGTHYPEFHQGRVIITMVKPKEND
jgi:hypothetical protein